MKKVTIVAIVVLSANYASALTFMGPPTTDIKQGQFGIGFDYAKSEVDMEIESVSGILTDVEIDTYLARLLFGIVDGAEVSARVGMDDIEGLDNDFAWGVGLKATIGESETFDWGVLFQLTALYGDDTASISGFTITGDFEIYEFQVAVGPTVKLGELSVYGGPFLHFITGDADFRLGGGRISFDLNEESEFGGYGGLSLKFDDSTSLAVEYQLTGDADALGINLLHIL